MGPRKSSVLTICALIYSCASTRPSAFVMHRRIGLQAHNPQGTIVVRAGGRKSNNDENMNDKQDDQFQGNKEIDGSYKNVKQDDKAPDYDEYDFKSQLNQISWLPPLLSKRRTKYSASHSHSRRENIYGDGYTSLYNDTPLKVELLPILPIPMTKPPQTDEPSLTYASGVWASEFENEQFTSPAYLPHTSHVLSIAEPRYKQLYDDLVSLSSPKRRIVVTVMHPEKEGVLAEYGVLLQLRDLNEVAAVASYDDENFMEEDVVDYFNHDEDEYDLANLLLDTHYEATHDVIGRVRLHQIVNPECWVDEPEKKEYLMAEVTSLDVLDNEKLSQARTMRTETARKTPKVDSSPLSVAKQLEAEVEQLEADEVVDAVSRIREELRSAVNEAFTKQQRPQQSVTTAESQIAKSISQSNNQTPLVPKGLLIERRSDGNLLSEERDLRSSFTKLVSLQQELSEPYRFTRDSVKSFGIGSTMAFWLSAAAWSKFIDKRLEGVNMEMQSELQEKLAEYLSETIIQTANEKEPHQDIQQESVDFDDLSPELQNEFLFIAERAREELLPSALQRAVQMQRIVQAESDEERLKLLKECVDIEVKRLQAKKMLNKAVIGYESDRAPRNPKISTGRERRVAFEKLMKKEQRDDRFSEDAFQ